MLILDKKELERCEFNDNNFKGDALDFSGEKLFLNNELRNLSIPSKKEGPRHTPEAWKY